MELLSLFYAKHKLLASVFMTWNKEIGEATKWLSKSMIKGKGRCFYQHISSLKIILLGSNLGGAGGISPSPICPCRFWSCRESLSMASFNQNKYHCRILFCVFSANANVWKHLNQTSSFMPERQEFYSLFNI